jgi:acetyl esterase/lipase
MQRQRFIHLFGHSKGNQFRSGLQAAGRNVFEGVMIQRGYFFKDWRLDVMSVKGRMLHLMMRHRHLLRGKIKREVITNTTSIEKLRKECDEAAERLVIMPEGIEIKIADSAPVFAEWIIPEGAEENKAILYFHGGCFIMGNVKSHRAVVSNFVNHVGYKTLLFDYRLAPEFPAPAAVNDSVEVYQWMLEQGYHPEDIIFAGDSAGGGIEIGTLIKLRDDGIPLPAACVAFSPSLDMTISGESHRTRSKADPCIPKGSCATYCDYYVGNGDPKNPYASPLFGDLTGLPPIMIHVGNDEVMRDDSTLFGEKADSYGVEVHVKVWKGMFHCFPLLAPMFEEATEAMRQVSAFIRNNMQKENGLAAAFLYMMMFTPYLSAGIR